LFIELDLNDAFNDEFLTESMNELETAMDNDFNTPNVITGLYSLVKLINLAVRSKKVEEYGKLYNTINKYFFVLGLDITFERMEAESKKLYLEWLTARKDKDFAKADELRVILSEKGVI
jgi:cysteinyl-tRNA synthetase